MSSPHQTAIGQASEALPGAARVGAQLRAARLRLGWALPEVAAGLRIRLAYLEAIEDGRVADLPGGAYAIGFLRTYASALGLDPDETARRFRAEAGDTRRTELSFPAPVPERGVPAGAAVLLGLLLAVGGYAGWYRWSGDARAPAAPVPLVPERLAPLAQGGRASSHSPQVASILPQPEATPAPPAAPPVPASPTQAAAAPHPPAPSFQGPAAVPPEVPAAPAPAEGRPEARPDARPEPRVILRARADAWVQVRERGGPVLLSRVLRAGESWPVPAGSPLLLTTGNAAGTELLVDGAAVPLGGTGSVRRDLPLDPDALRATDGARPGDAPGAGRSASTSRPPAQ